MRVGIFQRIAQHGVYVGCEIAIACWSLSVDPENALQETARFLRVGVDLPEGVGKAIKVTDGVADRVGFG